jgi:ATP-binding protein involved in chromosome partitioning
VSTPQDVALHDVRKGISMFRKVDIPVNFSSLCLGVDHSFMPVQITGIVLNQSFFLCPSCTKEHYIYGSPEKFRETAERMSIPMLAEFPVLGGMSWGGDRGVPYALLGESALSKEGDGSQQAGGRWKEVMSNVARRVWQDINAQMLL